VKLHKAAACRIMEVSRQAFYKGCKVDIEKRVREQLIVKAVRTIRIRQPRVGGKKLHKMIPAADFKLGRDKLFYILKKNDLLVPPLRSFRRTTNSNHRFRKYKNLIKDKAIKRPNEVFVADITYIDTIEGSCYLTLITDLYSRKIVGWDLSQNLGIQGCQRAARMALGGIKNSADLIHHSDRGLQFCSYGYVDILEKHGVKISMTEENHVYENAVAERVNGILKTEFFLGQRLKSFEIAKQLVAEAVKIYNEERLHLSLNYQTPAQCYAA
jgi:putative transposase